jgi:hypothetical protein
MKRGTEQWAIRQLLRVMERAVIGVNADSA